MSLRVVNCPIMDKGRLSALLPSKVTQAVLEPLSMANFHFRPSLEVETGRDSASSNGTC